MHLKLTAVRVRCLSLSLRLLWKELRFQLKHRYVASLILHASIVEITAQLLSILCGAYLILSDDGTIINQIFVQINILEGRAGYVVLMVPVSVTISYSSHCLTTETVKYINEYNFENSAASKYSMWHREANKCNNK